jgi:hypothetical protein
MEKKKNQKEIEKKITELQEEFVSKLKSIDPKLIPQLRVIQGINPASHFSDWHDNWKDGGRWVKTWGKSGGDSILIDEGLIFKPIDFKKKP